MKNTIHFAEVIESCLDHYTAQCWQWNRFPSFGSLVYVQEENKTIFGVVSHIQTGSMDPARTPFPYQKTEAELLAEQPQIFEFLKTTFTVQIVGYEEKLTGSSETKIYHVLPPTPCKIHAFIAEGDHALKTRFFSGPEFLHLLFAFSNNIPNLDELLLAVIKQLASKKIFDHSNIDNFCQTFTLFTGNDYRRLKLFLKRVEALL